MRAVRIFRHDTNTGRAERRNIGEGESGMKFCMNCVYAQRTPWQRLFGTNPYTFARCLHPLSTEVLPPHAVDGHIESGNRYCSVMRCKINPCGEDAKLFEEQL